MEKRLSFRANALYNTVGTLFYSFSLWVTVVVVARFFSSYDTAGIFQLAISVSNIFFAVSTYNMRTFQVSDTENAYSAGEYLGMRFVTGGLSLLLCVLYAIFSGYSLRVVACIGVYMIFKLNETMADVYHAVDQKADRMDYVGISHLLRGLVTLISFVLSLWISHDLLIALAVMAAAVNLTMLLYDVPHSARLDAVRPVFSFKRIGRLLLLCLPAVIASSSYAAVVTVPRQVLEKLAGEALLGAYGTVATPLVVVQVLATGIFNPLLNGFAEDCKKKDGRHLLKTVGKALAGLLIFALLAFTGAYFLGEPVLVLLCGEAIRPYVSLMYPILATTLLYAAGWIAVNLLIVLRRLKTLMVISLIALLFSALLSSPLIRAFGADGVSYTVIICYALHGLLGALTVLTEFHQKKEI